VPPAQSPHPETTVDVSVIVPAYRSDFAADTKLRRCLEALFAQVTFCSFEVLLAVSADSAAGLPTRSALPADGRLRVLPIGRRVRAAANRNRAARVARGRVLAFTDADVVVPSTWVAQMAEAATAAPLCCIAGSIMNGTPRSVAGSVEYVVEFQDIAPGRPAATAWHGATANLALTREAWDDFGPFVEDPAGGEDTILTTTAARQGRLVFCPHITVTHLNRTSWRAVLTHHYEFGRTQAHLGRGSHVPRRAMAHRTALAPVAGLVRIGSTYGRLLAWGPGRWRGLVLAPGIVLASVCYSAGLLVEGRRIDRAARRPQ
jgi:GT2 family glycosyltransferase